MDSPRSADANDTALVSAQTWSALRVALAELLGEDAGDDYLAADLVVDEPVLVRRKRHE